jgi:acyl-CoA thioesterase YciA
LSEAPASLPPEPPAIRVTAMPADLNPYGDMFGGWLMSQMALAAGSLASRHSRGKAVVVGAEALSFTAPVLPGDELSVYASLETTGRSSMQIAAHAWRRERDGEAAEPVAQGRFTFVALDEHKRPRPLPQETNSHG